MENGSERDKNDAADRRGKDKDAAASAAPAGNALENQIPLSENTQLALEIGRLQQENAYLKAKIKDLEADKKFFMEEARVRRQKKKEAAKRRKIKAESPGTDQQQQSLAQKARQRPPQAEPPPKPKKPRPPIQFKVPERLNPNSEIYDQLDELPEQVPLPDQIRFFWNRNFILIRRLALSVVVLGIFATVYFFVIKDSQLDPDENLAGRRTVAQLLRESRLYVDHPTLTLAVRGDSAKKRIEIADRLLEWTKDPEAQKNGTLSKIQALTRLELLNLEFAKSDPEVKRKLREITNASLDSNYPRIANSAHAAQALLSLLEFLDKSTDVQKNDSLKKQQRAKLIRDFETASEFASDDYTSAWALFDIAAIMNAEKSDIKIPELLDLFRNNLSASNHETIRNMAAEANRRYLLGQQRLTNVAEGVEGQVETLTSDLSQQIQTLLAFPDIEPGQFERIARSIAGVIQMGRVEEAQELLQTTLERIGSDEKLQPVRTELEIMRIHTGLIGQSFSISGLSELDGTPAVFRPSVTAKIVLFVNTPAYRQCVERLNNVTAVIDKLLAQTKVSIAIVFQDDGSEPEELAKLSNLKSVATLLDVWKIDLKSDQGQNFLQRFPIPTIPYLIIINAEDQLTAIDPPELVLESVIFEILNTQ